MPATYSLVALIDEAKPGVSPYTSKSYYYSLKRAAPITVQNQLGSGLSTNKVRTRWIKDHQKTLLRLREFTPSVRRSTVTALLIMSNHLFGENSKSSQEYHRVFTDLTLEQNEAIQANEKSETQLANWMPLQDIQAYAAVLPTDRPKDRRNRLLAFLYAFQPPARNDYGGMELLTDFSQIQANINYLFIEDGNPVSFIFQDYKTSGKYGQMTVPVSLELSIEIKSFLDGREEGYLFGKPLTKSQVQYSLKTVFEGTGKHVTINLLRHIWATEGIDLEQRKREKELAGSMMHSIGTQEQYAKK